MGDTSNSTTDLLNGKRHTILMIDDNPVNLSVMVDSLSDQGFQVLVARNGETGLELAEQTQPDMILLDIMLPGISGFDVCKMLKSNKKTCKILVIFMTALNETQEKIRGFSLGAVDYITKPFQQDEVLARVTGPYRCSIFFQGHHPT